MDSVLNLLLKRKGVLGLLPTRLGKSLIYKLFELKFFSAQVP